MEGIIAGRGVMYIGGRGCLGRMTLLARLVGRGLGPEERSPLPHGTISSGGGDDRVTPDGWMSGRMVHGGSKTVRRGEALLWTSMGEAGKLFGRCYVGRRVVGGFCAPVELHGTASK